MMIQQMLDPENMILGFEISLLSSPQAEVYVLPVLAAAILTPEFRLGIA